MSRVHRQPVSKDNARPVGYQYARNIRDHLAHAMERVFDGKLIFPRQLELHLPPVGNKPCNFACHHCQGSRLKRSLGRWEEKGLKIIERLEGRVPFFIFGGAYTEPLMNPHLPRFLRAAAKFGTRFGIHTNGSLFKKLEEETGLGSLITSLASSPEDYVSFSLDAGTSRSHCRSKNVSRDWFTEIVEGLATLVRLRGARPYPSIRVCYLMNRFNASPDEVSRAVEIAKEIGVDSLRFSIPYAHYGRSFDNVRRYRLKFEIPFGERCEKLVQPHLSLDVSKKPFIFWCPPDFQDVNRMNFRQCIYSYYQITFAADGYLYRCSSTASPSFPWARLSPIPDNFEAFQDAVMANHNSQWTAGTCFSHGARCNRIALEINDAWNRGSLRSEP